MDIWALTFSLSTIVAAIGFVAFAVVWLKKLRATVTTALGETVCHQVRSAQRNAETIEQLQRHVRLLEKRLETLTAANIHVRQDLNILADKIAPTDAEAPASLPPRLLH